MKKSMRTLIIGIFAIAFLMPAQIVAQKVPADAKIKMCNTCHKDGKNNPEAYNAFLMTTHAGASKVLTTEAAIEMATAAGIENPSEAENCLTCHTNKFEALEATFDPKEMNCVGCHEAENPVHPLPDKVKHPAKKE